MKEPGERFNPFVLYPTLTFLFGALVFGVVWYLLMSLIPELSPNDPNVQIRVLLDKSTIVIPGVAVVNGIVHLLNLGSRGRLLGRVFSESLPAAIYVVGQLMCGCILWIYS